MERGKPIPTPTYSLSAKTDDSCSREREICGISPNPEADILQVGGKSGVFDLSSRDPANTQTSVTSLDRHQFKISEFSLLNEILNEEFVSKSSSHIIYNANHHVKTQIEQKCKS